MQITNPVSYIFSYSFRGFSCTWGKLCCVSLTDQFFPPASENSGRLSPTNSLLISTSLRNPLSTNSVHSTKSGSELPRWTVRPYQRTIRNYSYTQVLIYACEWKYPKRPARCKMTPKVFIYLFGSRGWLL